MRANIAEMGQKSVAPCAIILCEYAWILCWMLIAWGSGWPDRFLPKLILGIILLMPIPISLIFGCYSLKVAGISLRNTAGVIGFSLSTGCVIFGIVAVCVMR
jgi:hypothetical protein